jgi:hypothetical protein
MSQKQTSETEENHTSKARTSDTDQTIGTRNHATDLQSRQDISELSVVFAKSSYTLVAVKIRTLSSKPCLDTWLPMSKTQP